MVVRGVAVAKAKWSEFLGRMMGIHNPVCRTT